METNTAKDMTDSEISTKQSRITLLIRGKKLGIDSWKEDPGLTRNLQEFGMTVQGEYEKTFAAIYDYFHGVGSLNPSKGILLVGKIGTGKTKMMRLFQTYLSDYGYLGKFAMKNVKEIERDYEKWGFEGIEDLMSSQYSLCIDDLGLERTVVSRYANSVALIDDILLRRYDIFQANKVKTHCTTNLGVKALLKLYPERTASRLKEMFNIVILGGEDMRK